MEKEHLFKEKFRIESTRLKGFDYSSNRAYFITICTQKHQRYLGEIINTEMKYSTIGKHCIKCFQEIPKHFPFVELDEFIVMPNHLHGILTFQKKETQDFEAQHPTENKFGSQSGNLASVIRGFKAGVKKFATMNNFIFTWQPRFYERVIRNEKELFEIRKYIIENPLKWEFEKNQPENFHL